MDYEKGFGSISNEFWIGIQTSVTLKQEIYQWSYNQNTRVKNQHRKHLIGLL